MSAGGRDELFALFERVCALSEAERESFLAELSRKDPAAARELAELLAQDERGGPLQSAASRKRSLVDLLVQELTGERGLRPEPPSSLVLEKLAARRPASSRYSIQGEVARGGMGAILEVWDEDIGRTLAMKVALGEERGEPGTPRLDARTLARFLEEAQVTGQLDHPGIVPVHELGMDREGRVYFTMRLVKGRDLGEIFALVREGREGWSETRALGVLLKVCEAMSYAHSNGIVHRDLKPSNVMVGRFGEVYVMDWGLARARDRREGADPAPAEPGAQRWLATQAGSILGTPGYMAPEQAAGRHGEVDERSDVYSLGAMLYELLAGRMPHDVAGEHHPPLAVLARVLAGPPEPLHALAPETPAELVAICEKAMSRDPRRRYGDMGELGEDLRAFLEGRVVRAHRTGPWVELRKWVGRNKGLAVASAAAITVALGGLGGIGYVEASGRKKADLQRASWERIADFMVGLFQAADPAVKQGQEITAAELLTAGRERLERGLEGDPLVRAQLELALGQSFKAIGKYDVAEPLIREAAGARVESLGREDPLTIVAIGALADVLRALGQVEEAERLFLEATAAARLHLGNEHEDTLELVQNFSLLLDQIGRYEESERLVREVCDTRRRILPADHPDTLTSLHNLGQALVGMGRYGEALPILEECLAKRRIEPGVDHPHTLATLQVLASLCALIGDYPRAEALMLECVERDRLVLGEDHPDTMVALHSLADLYLRLQRLPEAEATARAGLEGCRRALGDGHPSTLHAMHMLATIHYVQRRFDEAEQLFLEVLERGEEHGDRQRLVATMNNLAAMYLTTGRLEEAEGFVTEAYERAVDLLGERHHDTLYTYNILGQVQHALGNDGEAERIMLECLRTRREELGDAHPDLADSLNALERFYDEAAGPRDPRTLDVLTQQAELHAALGDLERALRVAETLVERSAGTPGAERSAELLGELRRKREAGGGD